MEPVILDKKQEMKEKGELELHKELPRMQRPVYPPAETFLVMAGNAKKGLNGSEATHSKISEADKYAKIVDNTDNIPTLREIGKKFYNLVSDLKA